MHVKAIILGADRNSNKQNDTPKIFRSVGGIPIIHILTQTVQECGISDIYIVLAPHAKKYTDMVYPYKVVYQPVQIGTGNAVLMAQEALQPFKGSIMILFGDTPLIKAQTIKRMIDKQAAGADIVTLGFIPADSRRYGRMIVGDDGLERIIEYKEATDAERTIRLCNSGVMCVNGQYALELVQNIKNDNSAGEYYITDIVGIAKKMGLKTDFVMGSAEELHGINSPEELEAAEELFLASRRKD